MIRASRSAPLIVAGGGVLYCEATARCDAFATRPGIPVGETQAGKGSLPCDHPLNLGRDRRHRQSAANVLAREADLVIAIGTRLSDFTTASQDRVPAPGRALHQHQRRRARRLQARRAAAGRRRAGRARAARRLRSSAATGSRERVPRSRGRSAQLRAAWDGEVERRAAHRDPSRSSARREVIGAVNDAAGADGRPRLRRRQTAGDLHKLWRARDPKALPPRIRLLVHGLRDRRRPRRQAGATRSARLRAWSATART